MFSVDFLCGWPTSTNPAAQSSDISPESGLAGSAGGDRHGLAPVRYRFLADERADQLLEQVFAFFDAHPDLPYVVLLADDSSATRDALIPPEAPRLITDGYYIPRHARLRHRLGLRTS